MTSIYGNATVTFAFTDNARFGSAVGNGLGSRVRADLDSRGWVLQEQLLSQRILYTTKHGLFWECLDNSSSESCPFGIPNVTDGFRASDERRVKQLMLKSHLSSREREMFLCMWRRNVVEEYSQRLLTRENDKLVAAAGITAKFASQLNDVCVAGIWKLDAARSLYWHTARPSVPRRPRKVVFPTWSWYSVEGMVLHAPHTPFETGLQRSKTNPVLRNDMHMHEDLAVLSISCQQDARNPHVYNGQVVLKGLTLRAYLYSRDPTRLFFPRRQTADEIIKRDLLNGTPNPARHDGGK